MSHVIFALKMSLTAKIGKRRKKSFIGSATYRCSVKVSAHICFLTIFLKETFYPHLTRHIPTKIRGKYPKLVETFHNVSECKTAIYFSWSLIHALAQPVQLFWPLVTIGVASSESLTYSDLQLLTET